MTHVAPLFTEYEQQVLRELALHRVQPNAIHRLLDGAGRPMSKLLNIGRNSKNRALRGLAEHVHGWIEEGLIKTFRAANRLANTGDISKKFAARGIHVEGNFDSLRYMPLSQLDAVADSLRWGSSLWGRTFGQRDDNGRRHSWSTISDSLFDTHRCHFVHDLAVAPHVPDCDNLWVFVAESGKSCTPGRRHGATRRQQ